MASPRICTASSTCSRSMTSGGPSMIRSPAPLTWPPEAYTIAPRFSASAWYVPTGQALAGREDVGPHARPVLHAEPSSGAAHARHHLVGDEEHAVAVARLSHEPVILGRWNDRSCRGADGRLRDEGGHRVGAFFTDLCLQRLRALE